MKCVVCDEEIENECLYVNEYVKEHDSWTKTMNEERVVNTFGPYCTYGCLVADVQENMS